jgi:hypothetical protein
VKSPHPGYRLRSHSKAERAGSVILPQDERVFNPSRETRRILNDASRIGIALLLKYSAGELNTLVNFRSAIPGFDGQFSIGVNSKGEKRNAPMRVASCTPRKKSHARSSRRVWLCCMASTTSRRFMSVWPQRSGQLSKKIPKLESLG